MISSTAPKTTFGANVRRTVVPRQAVAKPVAAQGENKVASTLLAGFAAVTLMVAPVQAATGIVPETRGFPVNVGVSDSDKSTLQKTEKTRDVVGEQLEQATGTVQEGAQNLGDRIKQALPNSLVGGTIGSGGEAVQRAGDKLKNITDERVNQAGRQAEKIGEEAKNVPGDVGSKAQNLGDRVGDAVKSALPNSLVGGTIGSGGEAVQRAGDKLKDITSERVGQAGQISRDIADEAKNAPADVGSQAQNLGDRVGDAVKGALPNSLVGGTISSGQVQQSAERVKNEAGNKLNDAGRQADKLGNAAGRQADKVQTQVENLADKAKNVLKPGTINNGVNVQQTAERAKNVAGNKLDDAGRQADKLGNAASNTASDIGSQAQSLTDKVGDAVKNALPNNLVSGNVGGANVQQNAERAKNAAGNKLDDASRQADKLGNAAGRQAEKAKTQVENLADKAKNALKPGTINAADVGNKLQRSAEQAKNEASRQLNNAGKQADKLANATGNKADQAKSQIDNAAQKVVKSVRL